MNQIGLNGGPELSPELPCLCSTYILRRRSESAALVLCAQSAQELCWCWADQHDDIFSQISANPATGLYLIPFAVAAVQSISAANTSLRVLLVQWHRLA